MTKIDSTEELERHSKNVIYALDILDMDSHSKIAILGEAICMVAEELTPEKFKMLIETMDRTLLVGLFKSILKSKQ